MKTLWSSSFPNGIDRKGVSCGVQQRRSRQMFGGFLLMIALLIVTGFAYPDPSYAQRRGDGSVRQSGKAQREGQARVPENRDNRQDRRVDDRRVDDHRYDPRDDYRRWNRHSHYHYHRHGHIVIGLPSGHTRIVVRGSSFFYFGGVYYTSGSSGYVVVAAPMGAVIARLPNGYTVVVIGGAEYFYYYGSYYVWRPGVGYVVVVAPIGATVQYMPDGYTTVYVGGVRYYQFGGVHYRPYLRNGTTVYVSVRL